MENSWMTLAVNKEFLFDGDVSKKWFEAYKLLGVDPTKLSSFSGRA